MAGYQLVAGRGAYDKRPRRVRNVATGQWLASPLTSDGEPVWTKDRALAWLGLAGAALRQIDTLRDAHGVEAEMD